LDSAKEDGGDRLVRCGGADHHHLSYQRDYRAPGTATSSEYMLILLQSHLLCRHFLPTNEILEHFGGLYHPNGAGPVIVSFVYGVLASTLQKSRENLWTVPSTRLQHKVNAVFSMVSLLGSLMYVDMFTACFTIADLSLDHADIFLRP
jgi:hypothetical protein